MSIPYLFVLSSRHYERQPPPSLRHNNIKVLASACEHSWCGGFIDRDFLDMFERCLPKDENKNSTTTQTSTKLLAAKMKDTKQKTLPFSRHNTIDEFRRNGRTDAGMNSILISDADLPPMKTLTSRGTPSFSAKEKEEEHQLPHFDREGCKSTEKEEHCNLTGDFKLVQSENFDAFLEAQGVNYTIRRLAKMIYPIHKIRHNGSKLRIEISNLPKPLQSHTTYQIASSRENERLVADVKENRRRDVSPVVTTLQDRVFHDTVSYLESGDGVLVDKVLIRSGDDDSDSYSSKIGTTSCDHNNCDNKYRIRVTRQLNDDGSLMIVTSRLIFNDGRKGVEAVQTFERL